MNVLQETSGRVDTKDQAPARLGQLENDLWIEPRRDDQPPEFVPLRELKTVSRKPPELRVQNTPIQDVTDIDAVAAPQLAQIKSTEMADFAFSVAELALRIEHHINDIDNAEAKAGIAAMSEAALMYEHLYLLQSNSEEVG